MSMRLNRTLTDRIRPHKKTSTAGVFPKLSSVPSRSCIRTAPQGNRKKEEYHV